MKYSFERFKKLSLFSVFLIFAVFIMSGTAMADNSDVRSSDDQDSHNLRYVYFDSNGGSGEMEPVICAEDGTFQIPDCLFTMENKQFAWWTNDKEGLGTILYPGMMAVALDNATLYAQWAPLPDYSYCITFDKNAESAEGFMENMSGDNGSLVVIPNCRFTNYGYDFTYWTLTPEDSGIKYAPEMVCPMVGDMTLFAQWTKHPESSVIYESGCDDSGKAVIASYLPENCNVPDGYKYEISSFRASAPGYVFKGWNMNSRRFSDEFAAPGDLINVYGDTKLTAQWISLPENFEPTISDISALVQIILEDKEFEDKYDIDKNGILDIFDLVLMSQYVADNAD